MTRTPRVGAAREVARGGGRFLRLEPLHLVLERAHLFDEPLDLLGHFLRPGAQQVARAAEQLLLLLDVFERAVAGHRLDAPQVRTDRPFAHDLDRADEAERVDVRATAQLDRRAGVEHAHGVAVLLAEERDRAEALGLGLARLEVAHRDVGDDLRVGEPFDLDELLVGDGLVVAEVEPQPVGRDQRAGLLHVRSRAPRASAQWRMWVAVWLRRIRSRRTPSIAAVTVSPSAIVPVRTRAWCTVNTPGSP